MMKFLSNGLNLKSNDRHHFRHNIRTLSRNIWYTLFMLTDLTHTVCYSRLGRQHKLDQGWCLNWQG